MEVDCEGCAGCCVDWRPLADRPSDHERRGPHEPLDDVYNLVPLTRAEVRRFCDDGVGDALVPRLWTAPPDADDAVVVDGHRVAAIGGQPAFFVGLRKTPKPVAPVGTDETRWLRSCVFLDPQTLQCRIHGDDQYPSECADYPGHNLLLERETECERVEEAFGDDRLVDDEPPESVGGLLLGPQALGEKVFVHPEPGELTGIASRAAAGTLTRADRAEFVGWAAASAPGTTEHSESHYETYRETVLSTESWVTSAVEDWTAWATGDGETAPAASVVERVEDEAGAPGTPGWDAVE
ncbi:YkgJ family cysteine cluster protein [Haloarchaeobius sp. FL176]|uniref:YkgJ family cysteine cluster protein n=1 Tax=Haloarchaeobius sp. FL176 TaxID=2967129 RepID=UPI002148819D|nr:YkgJ family cysteine cluster protein [Haloarchaeobius sp. FL176]